MHVDSPAVLYCPATQFVQLLEPTPLYLPDAQLEHFVAPAVENCPPMHVAGQVDVDPSPP